MNQPVPRIAVLTPRQRAVVGEIARDGADNPTIADRLGIAEDTVKSHVRAALMSTGMPNRTALVCALLRGELRIRTESKRRGPKPGTLAEEAS